MWDGKSASKDGDFLSKPYQNTILVTIHGVYSDNAGLGRISHDCIERLPSLQVYNCCYNQQHPFVMRDTEARKLVFAKVKTDMMIVRDSIRQQGNDHGDIKVFVIAHSLGSLALYQYLTQPLPNLDFESIILVGSILPRDVEGNYWLEHGQIRNSVINVVRPSDMVAALWKVYVKEETLSGTKGFLAKGDHRRSAQNTFKAGGHTSYYPSDVTDVANVLSGHSPTIIREDPFMSSLTRRQKARLKLWRALGFC